MNENQVNKLNNKLVSNNRLNNKFKYVTVEDVLRVYLDHKADAEPPERELNANDDNTCEDELNDEHTGKHMNKYTDEDKNKWKRQTNISTVNKSNTDKYRDKLSVPNADDFMGKKINGPKVLVNNLSNEQKSEILSKINTGMSKIGVGREYGLSVYQINRIIKSAK